jgi:hypothetical protein
MLQLLRTSINTRPLPSSEFPVAHTELPHAQLAFIRKFLYSYKENTLVSTCNVATDLSYKNCTVHLCVSMIPRINEDYLSIFIAVIFLLYDQNILRIDASTLSLRCLIARWNRSDIGPAYG